MVEQPCKMMEEDMDQALSTITKASRTSLRSLTFTVDQQLVRAVSMKRVMERFGYHLRSGYLDGAEKVVQLYHLTHDVQVYDLFLSHDWGTGRIPKFLALCAYNNLIPAVVASFLVSVVAMVLEIVGVLPLWATSMYVIANQEFRGGYGRWPLLLSPITYILMFFFWQHIRFWLRLRVADVFFDRFSVHQTDDELKAAAIMGIGGFIKRSEKFVILWSPQYFTRLWCVYEVATWSYLRRPDMNMIFIPVNAVVNLLGGQCLCFVGTIYNSVFANGTTVDLAITALLIACVSSLALKTSQDVIEDLLRIQHQLTSFSMSSATCHCCSVNHKDEQSGKRISCDRELVYETIAKWFASVESETVALDQTQKGLAEFETHVTDCLATKVIHKVSGRLQTLLFVALIAYPWFWCTCANLSFELALEPHQYRPRTLANIFCYLVVYIPLGIRFTILSARLVAEKSSSSGRCRQNLRRVGIFIITCCVWYLSCGLPTYARGFESNVPYIIVSCLLVGALLLLCRIKVLVMHTSNNSAVQRPMEEVSTQPLGSDASEQGILGRQSDVRSNDSDTIGCQAANAAESWLF